MGRQRLGACCQLGRTYYQGKTEGQQHPNPATRQQGECLGVTDGQTSRRFDYSQYMKTEPEKANRQNGAAKDGPKKHHGRTLENPGRL